MQEQYFNGIRFTIGPGRKYFSNSAVRPKSMHCYVWSYYNGEIPKGYDIHHIDGDRYNNDISNLQCIEKHEHRRLHGRQLTEEQREWKRNNINTKARPAAIAWHKSEAGKQWHKEHGKKMIIPKIEVDCICQQCGKSFVTANSKGVIRKFCSAACAQKYRRQNGLNDIKAVCCVCGKEFTTDKYRPKKTCSKSCAGRWCHMTAGEKYFGPHKKK